MPEEFPIGTPENFVKVNTKYKFTEVKEVEYSLGDLSERKKALQTQINKINVELADIDTKIAEINAK